MTDKPPTAREMGYYLSLAQIGMEMVAPVVLGVLLDVYVHTVPWGIIVGAFLGFGLGLIHLITLVNREEKADAARKEQDKK